MKICNMCGNKVNDNANACPMCGNTNLIIDNQQQMNNGVHYNHQSPEYSQSNNINFQQQYNNPMINQDYNMNQGYNQSMNNQSMNNQFYQSIQSGTKTSDKVGAVFGTIGIWYSINILLVLQRGLDIFINENLNDPKYDEMKKDPAMMAFSITWVALIGGIVALIIGLKNKKNYAKNGVNKYNIIAGLISLAVSIGSMIYIYNYLS